MGTNVGVDLLGVDGGVYGAELGADLCVNTATDGGVDLGACDTLNLLLNLSVE